MIKNIIFDLGAVVLNIDFQLSADAFRKLGIDDFESLYSRAVQDMLFVNMEKGIISPNDFRNTLRKLSNLPLSDIEIDDAWNALILDFPKERLQLIGKIKSNYRIFLLSNTNKIHYDIYQEDLKKNHNIDGLESIFEKTWMSHQLKMRKPDDDIYVYALNDANIRAEETVFIDDSIQNIRTANNLGIRTIFIDISKNMEISNYFSNDGKLTNADI
jgi:putative hydrolase of the HAD superfamily